MSYTKMDPPSSHAPSVPPSTYLEIYEKLCRRICLRSLKSGQQYHGGGSRGMLPQKNFEVYVLENAISSVLAGFYTPLSADD